MDKQVMKNLWIERKKQEGWKVAYYLVPEPLQKEIKELVRVWKFKNPQYYRKHI